MLQRGEQRVEFFQMGAVPGFELIDLGNSGGEGGLQVKGRTNEGQLA